MATALITPEVRNLVDEYDGEVYGTEKVFRVNLVRDEDTWGTPAYHSLAEAKEVLVWLGAQEDGIVARCDWVVEDYREGERYTRSCGAIAVFTDRGFECAHGHTHVVAEVRHAEGWDYFEADDIEAFRAAHVSPGVEVRDAATGKPVAL